MHRDCDFKVLAGWMMAVVGGGAWAPQADAAQLQLSTGVEYSSGNYGDTVATEALVVPFSAKIKLGHLSLRASVPWVSVRGPADITPVIEDSGGDRGSNSGSGSGGGSSGSGSDNSGEDDGTPNPLDRDIQGMGDASVAATWSIADIGTTPLYVDLTARVRLPTGSRAKGLGNGATDYAALAEIGWDGRRGGVFLSGGRRFLEQLDGSARVDGWQASGGYWRNIGKQSVFGMQGNWRRGSTAASDDPVSLDAYLTRGLSAGWKFEVSGSAGFTDANPDYAFGLSFIWRSTERR